MNAIAMGVVGGGDDDDTGGAARKLCACLDTDIIAKAPASHQRNGGGR